MTVILSPFWLACRLLHHAAMKTLSATSAFPAFSRIFVGAALALALGSVATETKADTGEWSRWRSFDRAHVSVSFLQVNRNTFTWKFRNDGASTITYMKFEYEDNDGTHVDFLPGSLRPNAAIGGWAAFTAVSMPTIRLVEVTRAGE